MSYQPGIPTGFIPLNQDYKNILANFGQINSQWEENHVPLTDTSGDPPNGYHTEVNLVPFSTIASNPPTNYPPVQPPTTPGYGQLWSAQVTNGGNTDTELFWLTGGGRNIQLTGNFVPVGLGNGYTSLPGGLILQFGSQPSPGSSGSVTYPLSPFPGSSVFSVIAQSTDPSGDIVVNLTASTTGFTYKLSSASIFPLFWMAIGK